MKTFKEFNEAFGFFRPKQKRAAPLPKDKSPEDLHDEYTDTVMHHLNQISKLTHPTSDWHRVIKKMGGNSRSVKNLHTSIHKIVSEYGSD